MFCIVWDKIEMCLFLVYLEKISIDKFFAPTNIFVLEKLIYLHVHICENKNCSIVVFFRLVSIYMQTFLLFFT